MEGKKEKKCCAYVLKIGVMKMHTSLGSVGNLSWLLYVLPVHVFLCVCIHVYFFFPEKAQ